MFALSSVGTPFEYGELVVLIIGARVGPASCVAGKP